MLTLMDIAMSAVAQSIWTSKKYTHYADHQFTKEVTDRSKSKIVPGNLLSNLPVTKHLKIKIEERLRSIELQWRVFLHNELFRHQRYNNTHWNYRFSVSRSASFFRATDLKLDGLKMVRIYLASKLDMGDEYLIEFQRKTCFEMACHACCEKEIEELWSELNVNTKKILKEILFEEDPFVRYWIWKLENDNIGIQNAMLADVARRVEAPEVSLGSETELELMVRASIRKTKMIAFEYFWDKMSPVEKDDKRVAMIKYGNLGLVRVHRMSSTAPIIMQMITELTRDEQIKLLREEYKLLAHLFGDLSTVDFAIEMLDNCTLTHGHFSSIFLYLSSEMTYLGEFKEALRKLWKKIPLLLKRTITSQFGDLWYIGLFVLNNFDDFEIFEFVLADVEVTDVVDLTIVKSKMWIKMLFDMESPNPTLNALTKTKAVDRFLRMARLTTDAIKQFKQFLVFDGASELIGPAAANIEAAKIILRWCWM